MYLTSGRDGSESDSDTSLSELETRLKSQHLEHGDGGLMRVVYIGAIIAIFAGLMVGAIATYVLKTY
jgi:hypothetical protein